jgi:hypothetical protein
MLKHHCSTFFISSHSQNTPARHFLTIFIAETTPSSTCFDFLPFVAETPLSATLHFSHPPSSTKQFRPAIVSPLSVAETPFVSNPSSFIHDAETPLFSMIDFFPMLKHHRSTLFHFLPILKTPVISSSSSTTIVPFFSVAETPVSHHRPSKQQAPDTIKSRRHNSITTNKHDIWLAEQTKW